MAQKSVEDGEYVPDRIKKLHRRIEENPFDIEGWNGLVREAQQQTIEKARKIYEKIVEQFPSAGRYWKIYIEHEMKARNYEKVEKLIGRCLVKILNIDLWKCYLNYVRETKCGLATYRAKMTEAYEFAIDNIGMDVSAYPVWSEYIAFLKSAPAVGSFAENQRITQVRKVYQRGSKIPMSNVEQLYREYSNFELLQASAKASDRSTNPTIARKMMDETNRDSLTARRVCKELEARTRGLQRHAPSVPPNASPETSKQVELWKLFIEWEKSNPMRSEDPMYISRRIMFAFEQCLLCLGYHPDVWYEAAEFLSKTSQQMQEKGDTISAKKLADETTKLYQRATSGLMRSNQLVHFAYADFEESRSHYDKVHDIYKKLIGIAELDPTLTYVQYMKFARRAEGIKSARQIFRMAREDSRSQHHVFVAAALMEYHCTKDSKIAHNIYKLGSKRFSSNIDYLDNYIKYMTNQNEDNNTRVMFERMLSSEGLSPEQSTSIWDKYSQFENQVGDLHSLLKIESRRLQMYKDEFEGKKTCLLVDRYRFLDLFPCPVDILRSIGYKETKYAPFSFGGSNKILAALNPEPLSEKEEPNKNSGYVLPDITQMLPYKPKVKPHPGHPVPGGEFPLPGPACQLLKLMPPPSSFRGPFVKVDDLMDKFNDLPFPKEKEWLKMVNEGSVSLTMSLQHPPTSAVANPAVSNGAGVKRRISPDGVAGDDDDDDLQMPPLKSSVPINDVYRSRQRFRNINAAE